MKKFVSILIALSLAISSLFAFSINAYANSLKTAVQIMLSQSINATVSNVDDNAKNYWFKFDCLSSNYYDLLTSSQALTSAVVFLTVYNADKTVINSNINSNTDLNFNTTTYFEAGKTYYIGIRAYGAYANGKNAELYVEKTNEDANTDDSE